MSSVFEFNLVRVISLQLAASMIKINLGLLLAIG